MSQLADLAERIFDVSQQGQIRLSELRQVSENSLQLQEQLLRQAAELSVVQADADGLSDNIAAGDFDTSEWEAKINELTEELQWTRSQLITAREELENAPEASEGVADEAELLAEAERLRRELGAARRELGEANERLELVDMGGDEVDARDGRIAELEAQVAQLEAAAASASDAASEPAEEEAVDRFASDSEIVAERENLRTLQAEWHEKLRAAELEISLERARMARERTEMEERVTMMESELRALRGGDSKEGSKTGKWFARLGLRDE